MRSIDPRINKAISGSAIAVAILAVWCRAEGAVLPSQTQQWNQERQAKVIEPFMSKTELTCDEIASIRNFSDMLYPNPYFLKRIDALSIVQGCASQEVSPEELSQAFELIPPHFSITKSDDWICRAYERTQNEAQSWDYIQVAAKVKSLTRFPKCLPRQWKWLWTAFHDYENRRYLPFESALMSHRTMWTKRGPELLNKTWQLAILSAKRRSARQDVLRYYREWHRDISAYPDSTMRSQVELWLMRWEAMLGKPEWAKPLVRQWKVKCRVSGFTDEACREFVGIWLSRFWYEGKDQGLNWLPNFSQNEQVLWWRAMRWVAAKNWDLAVSDLEKIRPSANDPGNARRLQFWLAFTKAHRDRIFAASIWEKFLEDDHYGDFYSVVARHLAPAIKAGTTEADTGVAGQSGMNEQGEPEPQDVSSSSVESLECRPFLSDQWNVMERTSGRFLVEDDVRWFSDRLDPNRRTECLKSQSEAQIALKKYCTVFHAPASNGRVPFEDQFQAVATELRLPINMLVSVSRQESAFCPNAVSWADAIGLMQLQWSPRIRSFGIAKTPADLFDPRTNVKLGGLELKRLSRKFQTNWFLALAAYNAGEDIVQLWKRDRPHSSMLQFIELMPFSETRDYVKRIVTHWWGHDRRGAVASEDLSVRSQLAKLAK